MIKINSLEIRALAIQRKTAALSVHSQQRLAHTLPNVVLACTLLYALGIVTLE
jgi:hypothetical protein